MLDKTSIGNRRE